jgi:hypothetical protein
MRWQWLGRRAGEGEIEGDTESMLEMTRTRINGRALRRGGKRATRLEHTKANEREYGRGRDALLREPGCISF